MAATQVSKRETGVFRMGKGFSLRTYEPPPEDFDLLSATDRQLLHHGLPRRPDATKEPEWRAAWDRALAKPTTWITPEFQMVEGRAHGPIRPVGRKKLPTRAAAADLANATSGNWSGAADFSAKGKPFKWVAGQWTVPNPHPPGSGSYYASEWVGIDGWGSSDVLQAGTETEVIEVLWFTITSVYAWWEWYPAGEVAITNLPVSAGDVMYCLICVDSASSATIYFSNQSTGVSTSFTITAPSGTTLAGNVAEWIVERPTVGGSVASLADYDVVYFDECQAGWVGGGSIGVDDLSSATSITMTGGGGADLSEPTIENSHLLKVTWRKAS